MGGKTKKSKSRTQQTTTQKTTFKPLPLGKISLTSQQLNLFKKVGERVSKRFESPLTAPGFATGRDFFNRRAESLKRGVRGMPNIFAGLRQGAERDIESTTTRALSDLIGQIQQGAAQNALAFSTLALPRGGVGAVSSTGTSLTRGTTSTPGVTFGEQLGQVGMQTLGSFGQSLGGGLGSAAAGQLLPSPQPPTGGASGAF